MALPHRRGLLESGRVQLLPISAIRPNPNQPRRTFDGDSLAELAASITVSGVLQPLLVRRTGAGYELIAGERRLRAADLAGLREVPCLVTTVSAEHSSLLALVENLQRRDLDFAEEATALHALIQTYGLSQEEAARRIGKSQSAVANKLRLLKLPADVLESLRQNGFTERHARALLPLPDAAARRAAAEHVIRHKLTVARTEAYVARLLSPLSDKAIPTRRPNFVIRDVRFFLNTVDRGLSLMRSAGVNALCDRSEEPDAILLTIRIPKA